MRDLASGNYGGERGAGRSGLGESLATGSLPWGSELRRRRESMEDLTDGRQDRRGGRPVHLVLGVWWDKRNAKRTLTVCG